MKNYLLILTLWFCSVSAYAQPAWQYARVDTTSTITANPANRKQVVAASSTSVLWSVLMNSKYNVSPAYYGDNKLVEYDLAGNVHNTASILGKVVITDIEADAAGNWYVLGKYNDSFQYGTFVQTASTLTAPYNFLMRLAAGSLQMQWFTPIGTNYYTTVSSMFLKGNDIYVAADSSLANRVYKFNAGTGSYTTAVRQFNGGYLSSVVADDNGYMYVAGSCPRFGSDTFGNHVIVKGSDYEAYIIRYKPNGDYDWSLFMNDITCTARKLSISGNNTIYYTGSILDSLTIGSIKISKPWSFSSNYIAASIDSTGSVRWVRTIKDTVAGTATLDNTYTALVADSMLVLAPTVNRYADFGNGVTGNYGTQRVTTIVAYKADGTAKWVKHLNADYTIPQHLTSNGKSIWLTGIVRDSSSLILDTLTTILKPLTPTPFIARLDVGTMCQVPVVKVDSVSPYIVIVSWDPIPGASGYEYKVSFTPPPFTNGVLTTMPNIMVPVQPNMGYFICVRSVCSNGSASEWSCTHVATPTDVRTFGIASGVNIYPNPAKHTVNIAGLDKLGEAQVRITSVTGSVLYKANITSASPSEAIDVASFARGMYFIEIKTNKERTTQKLILE